TVADGARLFDPLAANGEDGATRVRLALARALATLSGGELTVTAGGGGGAPFSPSAPAGPPGGGGGGAPPRPARGRARARGDAWIGPPRRSDSIRRSPSSPRSRSGCAWGR